MVNGLDGKPAARSVVTLLKAGSGPVTWIKGNFNAMAFHRLPQAVRQVETGKDGAFEFKEVLEGSWRVQAQTAPDYDYQRHVDIVHGSGGVDVTVSSREMDPLQIRLTPAFSLDVAEDWGDHSELQSPASHPPVMFSVAQLDDTFGNPGQADIEKTQRIEGLFAGRHFFEPGQFPTLGYYLAEALLNGQDVLGQEAEILRPGTLRLVYKNDGGSVRGTVLKTAEEKAAGALVLLMAQKPDGSRVGFSAWSGADRAFAIADVPPRDYSIMALERAPADVTGAEFESALARGERVRVEAGSAMRVELRVN